MVSQFILHEIVTSVDSNLTMQIFGITNEQAQNNGGAQSVLLV
jgi:hypothetical protein